MKAAYFDYQRPLELDQVFAHLHDNATIDSSSSKFMAGGQSLGPMLNLRLGQPSHIVDLARISNLKEVKDEGHSIFIGAGITHAALEDGRNIDPSHGLIPLVASNIAYRAVRNRGTLGGSLAHADPAADWVTTMRLLDATYIIVGKTGSRIVDSASFMQAAFTTCLKDDEILLGVRIAKCSVNSKVGYFKFCRKVGEFAQAIGAVLIDPDRNVARVVIGATAGAPYLAPDAKTILGKDAAASDLAIADALHAAGCDEHYEFQIHKTALKRAIAQAQQ
jgi:aerobic carbon-monoxide dehydrogenase medium subunit